MLKQRRSLRSLVSQEEEDPRSGSKSRRKTSSPRSSASASSKKVVSSPLESDVRPLRVHAQRKFASVVGPNGQSTRGGGGGLGLGLGGGKSSGLKSSLKPRQRTESGQDDEGPGGPGIGIGPGTGPCSPLLALNKRPKTEDFLTFLCLRGTDLLPPELDFFRKQQERSATILSTTEDQEEDKTEKESHEQESDSEDEETRGEEEARLQSKKVFQGKKKSSSVQALKRKYVAQRLAKQESRRVHVKPSSKAREGVQTRSTSERRSPRVAASFQRSNGLRSTRRSATSGVSTNSRLLRKKTQPSAAALLAKRKTQMARMLSCLAPRGTSNAAFLRTVKKQLPQGRALRKREVSEDEDEASTDEEESRRRRAKKRSLERAGNKKEESRTQEYQGKRSKRILKKEDAAKRSSRSRESSSSSSRRTKRASSKSESDDEDDNVSKKSDSIIYSPNHTNSSSNNASPESKPCILEGKRSPPLIQPVISPPLSQPSSTQPILLKKPSKEKKKAKSTSNLKELQDRLLLEAKKKIVEDEKNNLSPHPQYEPLRRLSKEELSARIPTPPRLFLPEGERSSLVSTPRPHIPVGVIGAALASTTSQRLTLLTNPQASGSNAVPLNQPLLINTGAPNGLPPPAKANDNASIPLIMPNNMMLQVRGGNHLIQTARAIGIQLAGVPQILNAATGGGGPTSLISKGPASLGNPLLSRPIHFTQSPQTTVVCNTNLMSQQQQPSGLINSSPLIMTTPRGPPATPPPPLHNNHLLHAPSITTTSSSLGEGALPNSNNNNLLYTNPSVTSSGEVILPNNLLHAPPIVTSSSSGELLLPNNLLHVATTASTPIHICTDVTMSNTQPLLSPGPPLLSPQEQISSNKSPTKKSNPSPPPLLLSASNSPAKSCSSEPINSLPNQTVTLKPSIQTPSSPPILSSSPATKSPSLSVSSSNPSSSTLPTPPSTLPSANGSSLLKISAPPLPPPSTPLKSAQEQPTLTNDPILDSTQGGLKPKCSKPNNRIFNKSSSNSSSTSSSASSASAATCSFKVENESSPYAFDVNDSKPQLSFRNNKPLHEVGKAGKKSFHVCKNEVGGGSSSGGSSLKKYSQSGGNNEDQEEDSEDSSSDETGGSFPIPPELASQLAAQAAKDPSHHETTYFIPLKNNSGQSFGVAVKLGTEGPPGPNQKVIMKAKLVRQPVADKSSKLLGGGESLTISLKGEDKKKKSVIMPSLRQSSENTHLGGEKEEEEEDSKERNRVILRDEPASCLGGIESFERFPKLGQHAHLIEAPIYQPSEKEFEDPIKYIEHIRREAEQFGICKIIPPKSFKPECNVDDDMRFTAYNQYIQKMMHRWGPQSKEMAAIKKYLATQNIVIKPHPVVGGVEIDLPALFHAVQSFGGLTEVIQRKKWGKIADYLRVPKGPQDRGNKLDELYCKYLLPYDTLSEVEREELHRLVEEEYEERNKKELERAKREDDLEEEDQSDESDLEEEEEEDLHECVVKGKSTSLSQFFRVARNHMMMIFKSTSDPDPREVEEEYWKLVIERDCHLGVQQGSIDAGGFEGFGFPTSKMSSCGRHPWNLKILSNNPRSLLRTMGPVMGVTVPTLHVGMLFTTGCWYRDPHGLPWVEYQHSGASKIWYGIPDSHSIAFYTAMKQLVPTFCKNKKIWLPSDTTMVPPNLLVKYGVSVCRLIQEPGQFVIVFPKAYTSNICSGYSVSESVYFAPRDYLSFAEQEFKDIRDSTEPMMFPLQKLILSIATDEKSSGKTLRLVRKHLEKIRDLEYAKRLQISEMGVKTTERINLRKEKGKEGTNAAEEDEEEDRRSPEQEEEDEYECEACSANLYVSFIYDIKEDLYYCLDHGIDILQKTKSSQRKNFKLLFTHSKEEITGIIKLVNRRIEERGSGGGHSSCEEEKAVGGLWDPKRPITSRLTTSEPSRKAPPEASSTKPPPLPAKSAQIRARKAAATSSEEEDEDEEPPHHKTLPRPPTPAKPQRKPVAKKKKTAAPTRSASNSSSAASYSSSSSSKSSCNRKTKREARQKTGNLASELLDMLLSTSEEDSEEIDGEESDSDESWK